MDVERQWRRKPAGKKVARALSSEMTNNLGRNSTPSVRQVTGESWETRAPFFYRQRGAALPGEGWRCVLGVEYGDVHE